MLQKANQTATEQGRAEQCISDFETTWSEFQRLIKTVTERGEAELCIFDFKTTKSEFQNSCKIAVMRGEAELYDLNKHHLLRVGPKQLCVSAHL